jgi:D-arginine dehydrogenase
LSAEPREVQIAVIGAGIAGVSLASELASRFTILVLDQEDQPATHATGRSAAIFAPSYGGMAVQALSVASLDFFTAPPAGFSDYPLLQPRGVLHFGAAEQSERLDAHYERMRAAGVPAKRLDAEAAGAVAPVFRPGHLGGAVHEPDAAEIDVHGLVSGYIRSLRAGGAALLTQARVTAAGKQGDRWRIETAAGPVLAEVVVNAAGAWADEVAALFGVAPVGLTPFRRTAVLVDAPGWPLERLPFCVEIGESFYFKPDAGRLMLSPGDETPSPPIDATADEMDIAIAVDRLVTATEIEVRRVFAAWAGLRTFAPDRSLVIGRDPAQPNFFWLAGQGGVGVQTAPAAARLAARLLGAAPRSGGEPEIDATAFCPSRFGAPVL